MTKLIKWYGYPAHFIGADNCIFHLSTRVSDVIVSTVGYWCPTGTTPEPLTSNEADMFETMVFPCLGESPEGNPIVEFETVLEVRNYSNHVAANAGHAELVAKYLESSNE